jgi:hypothetical protein
MYYSPTIISLIEVVLVLVPALVGIAYVTIAERKTKYSRLSAFFSTSVTLRRDILILFNPPRTPSRVCWAAKPELKSL